MDFTKSKIRPWNCALEIVLHYVSRCQHWVEECTLEKEENGYTSQKFLFASSNAFRTPLKISSVMLSQCSAQSWVNGRMWLMRVKENHKGEIVWDSRQWAGRHSRQVTLDANRICKHYISHPSLSHEFCIKLGKAETMRPKFSIWFMLCFIWYRSRYPQIALLI